MRTISNSRSRIVVALARVQLTETERRAAEDALEKGELIADLIIGAAAAIRTALQGIERGFRALARPKSTN